MKSLLLACLCLAGCLSAKDRALMARVEAQQKAESAKVSKLLEQQELLISATLLMVDAVDKVERGQTKLSDEAASKELHQHNQ